MKAPPCVHQLGLMILDQLQDPARFALAAVDHFTDFWPDQIDHHQLPGSEDVDMGRRMVIGIDHDPKTADAQDRGHDRSKL